MLKHVWILAQEAAEPPPPASDSMIVFGPLQITAIVAIIAILIGYKLWKNRSMN